MAFGISPSGIVGGAPALDCGFVPPRLSPLVLKKVASGIEHPAVEADGGLALGRRDRFGLSGFRVVPHDPITARWHSQPTSLSSDDMNPDARSSSKTSRACRE